VAMDPVDRTTLYASPIPECCLVKVAGSNSSRGVAQKKADAMVKENVVQVCLFLPQSIDER